MVYTPQELQRIHLRTQRLLGRIKKDDDGDMQDFMDQCIANMEDQGVDDAEDVCQGIWDDQGNGSEGD